MFLQPTSIVVDSTRLQTALINDADVHMADWAQYFATSSVPDHVFGPYTYQGDTNLGPGRFLFGGGPPASADEDLFWAFHGVQNMSVTYSVKINNDLFLASLAIAHGSFTDMYHWDYRRHPKGASVQAGTTRLATEDKSSKQPSRFQEA